MAEEETARMVPRARVRKFMSIFIRGFVAELST
jgi:hypothetical protein